MAGMYYVKDPIGFPSKFWNALRALEAGETDALVGVYQSLQEARADRQRFANFRWNLGQTYHQFTVLSRVRASIISDGGLHSIHARLRLDVLEAISTNSWAASLTY